MTVASSTDPNISVTSSIEGTGPTLTVDVELPTSLVPGQYFIQATCNTYVTTTQFAEAPLTVTGTPSATTLSTTLTSSSGATGPSISASSLDTVSDTVTLSGANASTATGSVTFSVYSNSQCSDYVASGGYFGGPTYEPIVVSGTESNPVSLPAGTYYWQVNYSGDANNTPAISPCTAEVETITGSQTLTTVSTNLSGPGTTGASIMVLPDTAVTDTATLSGTNAASAGGTASYTVYSDSACTDVIANAGTVDVSDGVVPASTPVTLGVGTYYWQASYSGDATNAAATSPCISETETVASPSVITLSTTLYAPSVQGPCSQRPPRHGGLRQRRLEREQHGHRRGHGHLHRLLGQRLHRRSRQRRDIRGLLRGSRRRTQ